MKVAGTGQLHQRIQPATLHYTVEKQNSAVNPAEGRLYLLLFASATVEIAGNIESFERGDQRESVKWEEGRFV